MGQNAKEMMGLALTKKGCGEGLKNESTTKFIINTKTAKSKVLSLVEKELV